MYWRLEKKAVFLQKLEMAEPTVLILDDDDKWLYLHRGKLEDAGFKCRATKLAKEAIDIGKTDPTIKFGLIDEILYVPPIPQEGEIGEKQRWMGSGVVRELTAYRSDLQFIVVTSAPYLVSSGDSRVLIQETARLRRQRGVIDIIHKQEIEANPEETYRWLIELLKKPQVNPNTELVKPRILIGLGFAKEVHDSMSEQMGRSRKKWLPLAPFLKVGRDRILQEFLKQAQEKTVWIEMPGSKKLDRLSSIKSDSSAFQILEFLALQSEQQKSVIIQESNYHFSSRRTNRTSDIAPDYDSVSVQDFAFGYGENGRRQLQKGVQIEGNLEQLSRLKVAIHRLSQQLSKLNVGPAKDLFNFKIESGGYEPTFELGIVLYPTSLIKERRR